jgi:choline dehydrogenase-like flavoprotein
VPAWDPRYGSNADTFGGGTRVYGAQAWRFMPEDFAMASTYGIPDGSALADWPIGYDELEPFHTQAEYEAIGLTTVPVPLAINSAPYDGRAACARCRQCPGFTCPVEAKNGSHNTVLARAAATGNLSILLATRAERIVTYATGRR